MEELEQKDDQDGVHAGLWLVYRVVWNQPNHEKQSQNRSTLHAAESEGRWPNVGLPLDKVKMAAS